MRWIREYYADEGIWLLMEIGDDGWPNRQVELRGADGEPVAAAALAEVSHARDHGGIGAVRAYEHRYGALAEGSVEEWDVRADALGRMDGREFETVWAMARRAIERRGDAYLS
ncbi:hypothetical protein [Nocardia macrotermitis]|uniref:Uncharacterized protein n=1 Tax=Nocardia macrotermitis TaxID=2585198 RepID=A0A7K0D9P1_9NOCA|nr:hypothetical protein [Nocardia macrotermitis]MQY22281.1 hypothetical protein [Nocardia macrotermitis]